VVASGHKRTGKLRGRDRLDRQPKTTAFDTPGREAAAMTLVAFDFDGTLSDSEMTVLLGERCGVAADMERITERAMNDEIGYAESLRERCSLLEDLPRAEAEAAFEQVVLRPDADEVIETLNEAGVHTAILTGGFERGVERALEQAGVTVDSIVANRLPMADGRLTGDVEGPLIEGTKDDALADLAGTVGVEMADTVAVGDGANDLPMLEVAGLAVGFEPKPAVEPACDTVVSTMAELQAVLEDRGVLA
jgi:phosphoserine phosphatase